MVTNIIDTMILHGWRCCHFRPAQTARGYRTALQGHAGMVDIIAARGDMLLFIEVKVGRNKLSPDQEAWRDALLMAGARWELWTDTDWLAGKYDAVLGINEQRMEAHNHGGLRHEHFTQGAHAH